MGLYPPSLLAGITSPVPWLVLLPCCFPGVRGGKQRRRVAAASHVGSEAVFRDLGCVPSRSLARGCAQGLFLQQQELQLVSAHLLECELQ